MPIEKHIFRTKVLHTEIGCLNQPVPRLMGKLPLVLRLFKQKRFWYDDPGNYTCDQLTPVPNKLVLVRPESLRESPMAQQLLEIGVPPEEQPSVIDKIIEFAQVAHPELFITVIILDITVGSLGNVDFQEIIDSVEREPINLADAPGNIMTPRVTMGTYESVPAARSSIEGLKKARLESLEEHVITHTPSCVICFKDFAECVDELITSLPCRHHYHVDCIVRWLEINHVCPLCRYPLPTADGTGDRATTPN